MKIILRRQKAQRTNSRTACAVVLAVGLVGSVSCALPPPALLGAGESSSTGRVEIPFKLYGGYTIVARGSVGDRDNLNFLIDTGSSSSVIDSSLARKLELAKSRKDIAVFASSVTTERVLLPSVQVGPVRASPLPAVIRDLSYFRESFSVHIDAIIGIDVLSLSSFTVDYDAKKLIFGQVERFSKAVACDPRSPYPTVPLRLGDRTVRVFVDTGAQELALFESHSDEAQGTNQSGNQETRTSMAGQVVIRRVEFHALTLGTTHWVRREGFFMEAPYTLFDGLLGPRWLGAKRITFDLEDRVISWED
jgi:predicted aspartyl protease